MWNLEMIKDSILHNSRGLTGIQGTQKGFDRVQNQGECLICWSAMFQFGTECKGVGGRVLDTLKLMDFSVRGFFESTTVMSE